MINWDFIETLLLDGVLAALASIGFAMISNPPRKAIFISALLAAIGHALRYYLMMRFDIGIAVGSFCASFSIGMLSMIAARFIHCPAETFSFPSLLPMIPGMYAYKTVIAFMQFMGSNSLGNEQVLIVDIFQNGLTTLFTITALVLGTTLPLLMFPNWTFTMTRIIKPLIPIHGHNNSDNTHHNHHNHHSHHHLHDHNSGSN